MVASIAASAFFLTLSSASSAPASTKASKTTGEGRPRSLDVRGIVAKPTSSSAAMQEKMKAQAVPNIDDAKVGLKAETQKADEEAAPSSAPRTFYNQLPDWSVLLAAVTTVFFGAEKQWTLLDWKPRRPDMLDDAFHLGKILQDRPVFKQNFSIRSYEMGADRTASIETLMNHLQEAALNHMRSAGLMGDGFGATPEMNKRNLIWVVTKMRVLIEHHPSWGDVVEVETWVCPTKKNGVHRDWHVRDYRTGRTILRASGVFVMMNKHTRKLSRVPEEFRAEIRPHVVERAAVVDEDSRKLPKLDDDTADYIKRGLTTQWSDLDINQHVNNVKYIGWILESAPISILENHELASMSLEYRRECRRDSKLQSLTAISNDLTDGLPEASIECQHVLQLEGGTELVKGRTEWRPKRSPGLGNMGPTPGGSA